MKMLIFINIPNCLTKKLQEGSKEWGRGERKHVEMLEHSST